jgi:acyl-CoA thioesterase FadM
MSSSPAGIVTYRGAVYATHCDHIGHMNIASYGAKFDEANWVFFCEIGLTPSYLRGERNGMAGVQQNISYRKELFAGDVIEIRTVVLEVTERRLCVRHEMRSRPARWRPSARSPRCTSTSRRTSPARCRPTFVPPPRSSWCPRVSKSYGGMPAEGASPRAGTQGPGLGLQLRPCGLLGAGHSAHAKFRQDGSSPGRCAQLPGSLWASGKYISFHEAGLVLRMPALCIISIAAPMRCGVWPKM